MSDIVERLLTLEHGDICYPVPHPVCQSAAAEITRLRAENERLRAALLDAKDMVQHWSGYAIDYIQEKYEVASDLAKIDAALKESSDE